MKGRASEIYQVSYTDSLELSENTSGNAEIGSCPDLVIGN